MALQLSRRNFLRGGLAVGATCTLPKSRVLGANDDVRVAIMGCGVMGGGHIKKFDRLPGVRVVAVSDPDLTRMDSKTDGLSHLPVKHQDFRRILDDKNVDAVVIATPNHWHSPMAILACQAGKHAYVQKPVSHGIWEGRKMVEAARRCDRIVQAGTQHRSDPGVAEVAKDIQAGKYGKVLWVHCLILNLREPIGKVSRPQSVPSHIDYELWCGPAPKTPVMRESFHYDWHWQWNWGDGEMGNWGPHYIDDVRHILGWDDVPQNVIAAGGRSVWDDDGETPNMHLALFEHGGVKVVVDIRNLPRQAGTTDAATYRGMEHGNVFICEGGTVKINLSGGQGFDENGTPIKEYHSNRGAVHEENFIQAIRSGRRSNLNAEIEIGHLSTVMCHLGNICYRVGQQATVEEIEQSMQDHEDAQETIRAIVRQIEANDGNLTDHPLMLGPRLEFDGVAEKFSGPHAEQANRLLRYEMRDSYAVPDLV